MHMESKLRNNIIGSASKNHMKKDFQKIYIWTLHGKNILLQGSYLT
jgi:hypothetical protein